MCCPDERRMHPSQGRDLRPTPGGMAPTVVSRMTITLVAVTSILGSAGCYTVKPIPLRQIDEYPVRESVSDVTVAVEALRDRACEEVFNRRLSSKGFVPVLVVVGNRSNSVVTLLGSGIQLQDEAGQIHHRVPARVVAAKYERQPGLEAVLLFGMLSFMDANQHNDKLHADWAEKELGQRMIVRPHTTVHGIAYFNLEDRPRVCNLTASVPIIDEEGQYHRVALALP